MPPGNLPVNLTEMFTLLVTCQQIDFSLLLWRKVIAGLRSRRIPFLLGSVIGAAMSLDTAEDEKSLCM